MIKLFKNLNKKDFIFMFLTVILIIVQVYLDLKMPDYMSDITVLVQSKGSKINDILINGFKMLSCAGGSMLLAIIVGYLVSYIAADFSLITRRKLFTKIEDLSLYEIKNFSTSSLITRSTNDITQIMMFISFGMQMLIKAPITAIWAVTKILNKSFAWSCATAVSVVILLGVVIIITSIVIPKFKLIQKLVDRINNVTRENLTGIRIIRAFNAEKYQKDKFETVNEELTNLQTINQKAFALFSPFMYLVLYFLTLSIYFIGAYLIDKAMMSDKIKLFGDMVVFSSYSMQIIMSFLMLAMIFMILPRASVSAKRINEVLNSNTSIINGKSKKGKANMFGEVEFRDVSFKYPDADEYILQNISFKAKKGETIAFIGSTGSGKSTLINLIPRFYDVTSGEVLVDGINVKKYDLKYLYNKIGYVSQKAKIFKGSVKSNILFTKNRKIKNDELWKILKVSQADEFVKKLDNKEESSISQSGTNLSGGQKQRLSIARAIASKPEIYIFDDSFSALDYKTDLKLRKALNKYTKDSTKFIVAQRIGTIMNADKIIVLDMGKCVGIGTHKELLNSCDVYKQIAFSQLSKEELLDE